MDNVELPSLGIYSMNMALHESWASEIRTNDEKLLNIMPKLFASVIYSCNVHARRKPFERVSARRTCRDNGCYQQPKPSFTACERMLNILSIVFRHISLDFSNRANGAKHSSVMKIFGWPKGGSGGSAMQMCFLDTFWQFWTIQCCSERSGFDSAVQFCSGFRLVGSNLNFVENYWIPKPIPIFWSTNKSKMLEKKKLSKPHLLLIADVFCWVVRRKQCRWCSKMHLFFRNWFSYIFFKKMFSLCQKGVSHPILAIAKRIKFVWVNSIFLQCEYVFFTKTNKTAMRKRREKNTDTQSPVYYNIRRWGTSSGLERTLLFAGRKLVCPWTAQALRRAAIGARRHGIGR